MKNMKVRIPMYFVGLFIMTIGIALSVKSNLGVSPVSSIPYKSPSDSGWSSIWILHDILQLSCHISAINR